MLDLVPRTHNMGSEDVPLVHGICILAHYVFIRLGRSEQLNSSYLGFRHIFDRSSACLVLCPL